LQHQIQHIDKINLGLYDITVGSFMEGEWQTQEFEDMFKELLNNYDIYARKYVETESITSTRIDKSFYLVQKDQDGDGIADVEFSYETTFWNIVVETETQ
jgi:hypothetical protein